MSIKKRNIWCWHRIRWKTYFINVSYNYNLTSISGRLSKSLYSSVYLSNREGGVIMTVSWRGSGAGDIVLFRSSSHDRKQGDGFFTNSWPMPIIDVGRKGVFSFIIHVTATRLFLRIFFLYPSGLRNLPTYSKYMYWMFSQK